MQGNVPAAFVAAEDAARVRATVNRKFRATIGTSGPWRSNQEAEASGAKRVQLPTADKLREADRPDGDEGLEPEVAAMLATTDKLVRQYQEELSLKHELERVQNDNRASSAEPRVGAALCIGHSFWVVLGGAVLGGAVLGGAVLGGAVLGGAVLGGAVLGGAVPGGAVLGGAVLGREKVAGGWCWRCCQWVGSTGSAALRRMSQMPAGSNAQSSQDATDS
jgi:hypothetical protein